MWERLFGVIPPNTSISPKTYEENDLPWFNLYSELPSTEQAGQFQNMQSISEVDDILLQVALHEEIDPADPPICSKHDDKKTVAVFRPCNHLACEECLFATLDKASHCFKCETVVEDYIGFTNRIDRNKLDALMNVMEVERNIKGVSISDQDAPNVISLILEEDKVSPLKGSSKKHQRE